ncbi:hypothetical protein FD975_01730 [Polynucleobacter sp. AP-Jannik-300A-C4]|uniref:hypothetical protein n=1 Tax=Polynucleobacter sp. AP-Jannik-300A-C4 TaxID=2576928 RepID=UPI001BFE2F40|nr:hypothetical protein [Polynucleobacter sp. AP-Jannik-300A-C4]QWE22952.1 hypothetical protein FD975_01730 [Polynucleobacter sp. AP-Jannik-300A-C4]
MNSIEFLSLIFGSIAVLTAAGLWSTFFFRNLQSLEIISIAVFAGISTIALIGQVTFYFLGSFSTGVIIIVGISILGVIGVYLKRSLIAPGINLRQLSPLIIVLCSALILDLAILTKGPRDYPGSNNPDMWYYAAVVEAISNDDNNYISYPVALKKVSKQIAANIGGAFTLFSMEKGEHQNSIHDILVDSFVRDDYFYFPGKTPLIMGVTTRNGAEFIVAYLKNIFNLEVKVAYNLIFGIYPILSGLAALWLVSFLNLSPKTIQRVAILSSFSPLIYGGAFTQWPAMTLGIPLIAFTMGVIFRIFFTPTNAMGIIFSLVIVGSVSVYPEGLSILFLPTLYLSIRAFNSNKKLIIQIFRIIWGPLIFIILVGGIPSVVLSLYRILKITGKFAVMPGPDYVSNGTIFYSMWIQPSFLHKKLIWIDNPDWISGLFRFDAYSVLHLVAIILGTLCTFAVVFAPWVLSHKHQQVTRIFSAAFIALAITLFLVGSAYSIDKLIYYYPIFFAVVVALVIDRDSDSKSTGPLDVRRIILFSWICLASFSIGGLAYAELENGEYFIPDKNFLLEKYTDLRSTLALFPKKIDRLMVAIPDEMPQLWVTHYMGFQSMVLPHGLNYLSNFVETAKVKRKTDYPGEYEYMIIPGTNYPTIEDYRYIQKSSLWGNGLFAIVPRGFFFVAADPISYGPVKDRAFFRLERDGAGRPYRWVNTGLKYKYFNRDLIGAGAIGLRADCESVNADKVNLAVIVDNKKVEGWILQGRQKFQLEIPATLEKSGTIEIVNENPRPIVFPRDERPVTFRCFSVQIGNSSLFTDPSRRPVITSGGAIDLVRSDILGLYGDGWAEKGVSFLMPKSSDLRHVTISGSRSPGLFSGGDLVKVRVGGANLTVHSVNSGDFSIDIPVPALNADELLTIEFGGAIRLPLPDVRNVSAFISKIAITK